MEFQWLGLQEFEPIYQWQKESLLWPMNKEIIVGLEHPLIVTLGRRATVAEELSTMSQALPTIQTDRGGLATLHSPGQLVIYPLVSLDRRGWGPRQYVCQVLKITQQCLLELGVESNIDETQSGLFVNNNKICFLGLRIAEGRVYHGLSLNVCNDLALFNSIRACGVQSRPMTSLRELGIQLQPSQLFERWQKVANETSLVKIDETASLQTCR